MYAEDKVKGFNWQHEYNKDGFQKASTIVITRFSNEALQSALLKSRNYSLLSKKKKKEEASG